MNGDDNSLNCLYFEHLSEIATSKFPERYFCDEAYNIFQYFTPLPTGTHAETDFKTSTTPLHTLTVSLIISQICCVTR